MVKLIPHVNAKHCHFFDEGTKEWADVILSTKRDMREQMGSLKRYLKVDRQLRNPNDGYTTGFSVAAPTTRDQDNKYICCDIKQEIEVALKNYNLWKPHVKAEFILEDWFTAPEKYITQLTSFFNLNVTTDEIIKLKNHHTTHSVPGTPGVPHITKKDNLLNYKETLTPEEIEIIYHLFDTKYKDVKNNHLYLEEYLTGK
jgi:hypothetical protein